MKILMVGGTRFVGRHIVEAALHHGHDVTLVHRTATELFPEAEHLLLDRDGDLSVLDERDFDATIDASAYFPRQVRALAAALGGRGGQYVLISSVSAYDIPAGPGYDESSPLLPPAADDVDSITNETYGPLKVSCELAATELFGAATTIVRPTYVIGPWDYTRRFTSWVERIAEGGEVLGPGSPGDPAQVIDGRDMGAWIVRLVENGVTGAFHAASPPPPYSFADLLGDIVVAVGPPGTTVTWVDQQWLLDQGEDEASFPLWAAGDPSMDVGAADPRAAALAGLQPRPVRQSVLEILEDLGEHPLAGERPGLSREREAELLAAWHARG